MIFLGFFAHFPGLEQSLSISDSTAKSDGGLSGQLAVVTEEYETNI